MKNKGIVSIEFILCVLIILIIILFFVSVNISFAEKLEKLPTDKDKIISIKEEYFDYIDWKKHENTKSASFGD